MPTRLAAALFTAGMVALAVVFHVAPTWYVQAPIRIAAGVAVVLAVRTGIRGHKPAGLVPWVLLAAAMALSSLGSAAFTASPAAAGHIPWLPDAGRGLLLAAIRCWRW